MTFRKRPREQRSETRWHHHHEMEEEPRSSSEVSVSMESHPVCVCVCVCECVSVCVLMFLQKWIVYTVLKSCELRVKVTPQKKKKQRQKKRSDLSEGRQQPINDRMSWKCESIFFFCFSRIKHATHTNTKSLSLHFVLSEVSEWSILTTTRFTWDASHDSSLNVELSCRSVCVCVQTSGCDASAPPAAQHEHNWTLNSVKLWFILN